LKAVVADKAAIRILVLDDEHFMLKLHVHMLAGLGYTSVTACDNGPEALEWVDAPGSPPDLVLLDLNMPRMDGIEFVRKLVERGYAGSLVLVSGEDEGVLRMANKLVQAHRIPVLGHIRKPLSLAALALVMDRWAPACAAGPAPKAYTAAELRAAIDDGELVLHYQPKVFVATGAIAGVEALVRWCHPVDGLVFPERFIGLAEDEGLIDALTRVVLTRAMADATAWQRAGLQLRMSINISMDNLASVDFADFVATAAAVGVAPQDILLEVTESRLMLDARAPLEILTRLRLKRFRLSIDDFGTGHSSLSQLQDIAFDELKIDRGFVHGAWRDATMRAMYYTSLGLGMHLGMQVVAEGVEDREDWDFVRATGCEVAQGFFIARPMPAAELAGWVESWTGTVAHADDGTPAK
jgi:EAL domain-containing protein (putative c-di-GMP-specific phosphodiesterase class I)/FixJ family two-component response regulator